MACISQSNLDYFLQAFIMTLLSYYVAFTSFNQPKRSWWFKSQVFLFTMIVQENLYFITENKTIYSCCCLWCFLCSIEQQVVLNRKGVKGKLVYQSLSSNEYKLCRVSKNEEADVTKSLWRAVSDVVMEWMSGFLQVALDTHEVSCLQTNLWQGRVHVLCWDTKVRTVMEPDQQRPVVKSTRKRLIRGIFEVTVRATELRSDRGGN